MGNLEHYLNDLLGRGRSSFSKDEALRVLDYSPKAFTDAATRLIRKRKLAIPWRGFYLILRPEDNVMGVPDPASWIDPLMKYLGYDYRISLLKAAAIYGSSHQANMSFQVIVPKQLRDFEIGRHRIQFVYQVSDVFESTNSSDFLESLKSEYGFSKMASPELVLLDCVRYCHKIGGINALSQIVYDLGKNADPKKLARVARSFENSSIRRLGYLLDRFDFRRQASAIEPFARQAKSIKPLVLSVKPFGSKLTYETEISKKWMLLVNEDVEIDL